MKVKFGTTRICILVGKVCIKIPCFRWQYTHFLLGLVNNTNEYKWSKLNNDNLAKCYFKSWGGFILVMERCKPLSLYEFEFMDYKTFITETISGGQLPVENKKNSFGKNTFGKIVAIDYH